MVEDGIVPVIMVFKIAMVTLNALQTRLNAGVVIVAVQKDRMNKVGNGHLG